MPNRSASFHNTIEARGPELDQYESRAKSQENIILEFFKSQPNRQFSPSEVFKLLKFDPMRTPPQSIRRAITNLTKAGELRKTDILVPSPYGSSEHLWYRPAVIKQATQLELF